jgi:hypothetical protein
MLGDRRSRRQQTVISVPSGAGRVLMTVDVAV